MAGDQLELSDWHAGRPLTLARGDIVRVDTAYTKRYGRFVGGLLNSGKPLILETRTAGTLYLLINRSEFMERTDDRRWRSLIEEWLAV